MKKSLYYFLVVIAITMMVSCGEKNPIWDREPVTNALYTDENGVQNFPLDLFHQYGVQRDTVAQRRLVDSCATFLTGNTVRYCEGKGARLQSPKNIRFCLGSGFAKGVLSGNGNSYDGNFENELIVIINDPNYEDTLFLACGNGQLYPIKFSEFHDLTTGKQWIFVVQPGDGLADFIPKLQEWGKTAEDLGIPIKNKKNGNVTDSHTYLNYLGEWESLLFPGDTIDMALGEVRNHYGRVDFNRRLEESKKANAKRAENNKRVNAAESTTRTKRR